MLKSIEPVPRSVAVLLCRFKCYALKTRCHGSSDSVVLAIGLQRQEVKLWVSYNVMVSGVYSVACIVQLLIQYPNKCKI